MQESDEKLNIRFKRVETPSRLLECMMICSFHHLQGPSVEWVYPPTPVGRWHK
jgi:hypothetical protein